MDIKTHTTEKVKLLLAKPYYQSLWQRRVTPESFKLFIAQRTKMATNFERLLHVGQVAAKKIGAAKLAAEFAENLADEQAIDEQGMSNAELAHKTWRNRFLMKLNLNETSEYHQHNIQSVEAHHNYLIQLEQEANPFKIAGAILLIERFVPLEFRGVKLSRDDLFPELFVINENDTESERGAKMASCHYIDDHITHDAKIHFPDLLNAIYAYKVHENYIKDVHAGIEEMAEHRLNIFNDIQALAH